MARLIAQGIILAVLVAVAAAGEPEIGDCALAHDMRRALMNYGYSPIWSGRNDADELVTVWQTPSATWATTAHLHNGQLCVIDTGWRAVRS